MTIHSCICGKPIGTGAVQSLALDSWYCSKECLNDAFGSQSRLDETGFAVKYDQDKLPFHLISIPALEGLAQRLQHGATKYAERNWEKGLDWSRCYRAALGHLFKWWIGEDIDSDSGLHHIDAALCNVMFLSHYCKDSAYKKFDNRPGKLKSLP